MYGIITQGVQGGQKTRFRSRAKSGEAHPVGSTVPLVCSLSPLWLMTKRENYRSSRCEPSIWSTRYGVTILPSPLVDDLWTDIFVNIGICSCETR